MRRNSRTATVSLSHTVQNGQPRMPITATRVLNDYEKPMLLAKSPRIRLTNVDTASSLSLTTMSMSASVRIRLRRMRYGTV